MSFPCHNYGNFTHYYDHTGFYDTKSNDFLRKQSVHYRIRLHIQLYITDVFWSKDTFERLFWTKETEL